MSPGAGKSTERETGEPRSPKTIKRIGFHQRLLFLVGNFNYPKLGTMILIALDI